MKTKRSHNLLAAAFLAAVALTTTIAHADEPLPSWNDGMAKNSIIAFVERVTTEGSPDFLPVAERIAVFDNDGTLWCEQPIPVQLYFALDRVKALAPQHPEWKDKEPFSSLLKGDFRSALAGGEHAIMEFMMATHTGMTTVEFEQIVKDWIASAKHPITGKRFVDMTYQPMLEVLAYLKAYPQCFALDATHTPHITMLQCFVRTADLPKLYAATEKVLTAANVNAMKLEAFKLYYLPAGSGLGVAGICATPTPEILKLQADIIAAAAPFNLRDGPIGAFTAGHDNPAIDTAIIEYVSTFEQIGAGKKFNPHVSTGNAPTEYLDKMLAEPFESFTFSPAGAAVYQLGPYGTAAGKLKDWDLQRE
jgi:hypothetical protein